jgi:hypothetical protein
VVQHADVDERPLISDQGNAFMAVQRFAIAALAQPKRIPIPHFLKDWRKHDFESVQIPNLSQRIPNARRYIRIARARYIAADKNTRPARYYRWRNEVPTVLRIAAAAILLVTGHLARDFASG